MANKRKPRFRVGQVVAYVDDSSASTFMKIRRIEGPLVWLWGWMSSRPMAKLRPLTKREIGPRSPSASKEG